MVLLIQHCLYEPSAIVPARQKANNCENWQFFRAAIQLQFDFHRAIHDPGTVLASLIISILICKQQRIEACVRSMGRVRSWQSNILPEVFSNLHPTER
ncbi:hypothetical protein OIU78_009697 [Salix suchowensis]|nr:hypothetical protein OIU78_009697 [Salix suchowensis]